MGCAPAHKPSPGFISDTGKANDLPAVKPATTQAPVDWKPDDVEVSCAAGQCPLQVGALMFAGQAANNTVPVHRCTAFLVAPDMVMSNGHCDRFGKEKGYFVSQRINGQKEIREIVAVPFKRFTAHKDDAELSSGRPDVALFQLNRQIGGVPPLRLASGAQPAYKQLTVFAIMQSPSANHLTIQRSECTVRRHEAEFPFDITEGPDVIVSYGCQLEAGTSGSPMFAAGSEEVQAVQMGGTDPSKRAAAVRKRFGRELLPHEKHWTSVATNVRCLDLPGRPAGSCLINDETEASRRFQQAQLKEMEKLRMQRIKRMKPTAFQLAPVEDMRFEVVHRQDCRESGELPRQVTFLIEQVKVELDPWASPKAKSLSQVRLNAEVKSSSGDSIEVEVTWPAPGGAYLQPDLDLRKKWGNRFHIDLPICPR